MRDLGFFSRNSARLSRDRICRTRGDSHPAFSARATSSIPPVRLRGRGPRNACGRYERGHPIRDRDTGAAAVHPRWPRRTVYQPQSHCALRLGIHERRQQLGEPVLHVARPVESALEQRLESLLRFRPRQRRGKGVEGIEKAVGGRQRHFVNEILRRSDRTPIEGSDSPRASASTKPSSSLFGSARLTYPYRSAVSPSKSFPPSTISSARPRPTRSGRRSVPPPPGCTPAPTST